jgi:hypothetical protein
MKPFERPLDNVVGSPNKARRRLLAMLIGRKAARDIAKGKTKLWAAKALRSEQRGPK